MNVCVFCGSSPGSSPVYAEAARTLGALLAASSHTLIYGGGHVGLMGIVADSVMVNKGEVIGIIPQFLVDREVGHYQITRLEVVQSMHERKKRMADLSDAFVAFPGGMGTLEELAEILTWKQLGLINNPVVIFNLNNFFTPLLTQLDHMVREGFLRAENVDAIRVAKSTDEILSAIIPQ
jgi:uncharacterized protein (TIGR00730 family)